MDPVKNESFSLAPKGKLSKSLVTMNRTLSLSLNHPLYLGHDEGESVQGGEVEGVLAGLGAHSSLYSKERPAPAD